MNETIYEYLMKSWEEYKKEPLYEQFGDFLRATDAFNPNFKIPDPLRKEAMENLARQIIETARAVGRKPTKFYNWVELAPSPSSNDPLGLAQICGWKMWLELANTPEAYAHRIHEIAREWIEELKMEIKTLQTWKGFLGSQWERLLRKWRKDETPCCSQ